MWWLQAQLPSELGRRLVCAMPSQSVEESLKGVAEGSLSKGEREMPREFYLSEQEAGLRTCLAYMRQWVSSPDWGSRLRC